MRGKVAKKLRRMAMTAFLDQPGQKGPMLEFQEIYRIAKKTRPDRPAGRRSRGKI